MGEEIGEHLEKRSPLKDECRKNYLRKIHAGSHLRQQVRDDGTVLIQRVDCNDHMTYELGAAYAINNIAAIRSYVLPPLRHRTDLQSNTSQPISVQPHLSVQNTLDV